MNRAFPPSGGREPPGSTSDTYSSLVFDTPSMQGADAFRVVRLRGMIFDLDGTLVDSQLDFRAIRRDLGLPTGHAILEALAEVPEGPEKDSLRRKLREHELRGAACATLFPGVAEMLAFLDERAVPAAVLTRNSRESTNIVLDRLGLRFSHVVSREDAPPKPDPGGLLHIAREWNFAPEFIAFCGDYLFDLQAGRSAGMVTVLYAPTTLPPFADQADHILHCFTEFPVWWERNGSRRVDR